MATINLLGRLIIVNKEHILVVREVGQEYVFLPGGHVEYGEGVKQAIRRELMEEFGGEVVVGDFLGVVEHCFDHHGRPYYEISLVFSGDLRNFAFPETPRSRESHLEFLWHPLDGLDMIDLKPRPMRELIACHRDGKQHGLWRSTIETKS
jgi:8-oxo-dGTP diphosphatase